MLTPELYQQKQKPAPKTVREKRNERRAEVHGAIESNRKKRPREDEL
jgi:hypothetical protein